MWFVRLLALACSENLRPKLLGDTAAPEQRTQAVVFVSPCLQASTCGSFSVGTARSRGINAGSSSRSGITLSVPAAGEAQEGFGSCVYDEGLDVSSNTLSTFSTPGSSSAALSCGSNSQNLPASSVSTNITGPNGSSGANALSRSSSSCAASITSARAAAAALAVCRRIEGLRVGGLIAAGSYGRVYRGDYYGSTVRVLLLRPPFTALAAAVDDSRLTAPRSCLVSSRLRAGCSRIMPCCFHHHWPGPT